MRDMPANGVQHTLWQFLATVHRNLPGTVTQRRVAVARDQQIGITLQIHPLHFQRRRLFLQHQRMRGQAVIFIFHAVINVLIARQIPEVRQE